MPGVDGSGRCRVMADYTVTNPAGDLVLQTSESCRYPKLLELALLEAGYTIRLHGTRLTKTMLRKAVTDENP